MPAQHGKLLTDFDRLKRRVNSGTWQREWIATNKFKYPKSSNRKLNQLAHAAWGEMRAREEREHREALFELENEGSGLEIDELEFESESPFQTQLYFHYGVRDELLYVGISLNALYRLTQHRSYSRWYKQIVRIEIENYPTREKAMEAEREAIRTRFPKFNITHSKSKKVSEFMTTTETESRDKIFKFWAAKPIQTHLNMNEISFSELVDKNAWLDRLEGNFRQADYNYEERKHLDIIRLELDVLQRELTKVFAGLNGWYVSDEPFPISNIGRPIKKKEKPWLNFSLSGLDHPLFFKRDGLGAAIVTQPYAASKILDLEKTKFELSEKTKLDELAQRHGLKCYGAPNIQTSIYRFGSCEFYVLASPYHEMKWLPEQRG